MTIPFVRILIGTILLLFAIIGTTAADEAHSSSAREPASVTLDLSVDEAAPVRSGSTRSNALTFPDPLDEPIDAASSRSRKPLILATLARWTREPVAAAVLSLAIVVLGYLLLRRMLGGKSRRRPGFLPRQVVEVIGYIPMGNRQQLQLVRLGSKLVLVAVTASGAKTLAEVTDPVEVDQILSACRCGPSALANVLGRFSGRSNGRDAVRAIFEA